MPIEPTPISPFDNSTPIIPTQQTTSPSLVTTDSTAAADALSLQLTATTQQSSANISIVEYSLSKANIDEFIHAFQESLYSDPSLLAQLIASKLLNNANIALALQNFQAFQNATTALGTNLSSGATGNAASANTTYKNTANSFNSTIQPQYNQLLSALQNADSSHYAAAAQAFNHFVTTVYNPAINQINSDAQALYTAAVAYNAAVSQYITAASAGKPTIKPVAPITTLPPQPPLLSVSVTVDPNTAPNVFPAPSATAPDSTFTNASLTPATPGNQNVQNSFLVDAYLVQLFNNISLLQNQLFLNTAKKGHRVYELTPKDFEVNTIESNKSKAYARNLPSPNSVDSFVSSGLLVNLLGDGNPQLASQLSDANLSRIVKSAFLNDQSTPTALLANITLLNSQLLTNASLFALGPSAQLAQAIFNGSSFENEAMAAVVSSGVVERMLGLIGSGQLQGIIQGTIANSLQPNTLSAEGQATLANNIADITTLSFLGISSLLMGSNQNNPGIFLQPVIAAITGELSQNPQLVNATALLQSAQSSPNGSDLQNQLVSGFTETLVAANMNRGYATDFATQLAEGLLSPNNGDISAYLAGKINGTVPDNLAGFVTTGLTSSIFNAIIETQAAQGAVLPPPSTSVLQTAFASTLPSDQASQLAATTTLALQNANQNNATITGQLAALHASISNNLPAGASLSHLANLALAALVTDVTVAPIKNKDDETKADILKTQLQEQTVKTAELTKEVIQKQIEKQDSKSTTDMVDNFAHFMAEAQKPSVALEKMKEPATVAIGVMYEGIKHDPVHSAGIQIPV